VIPAQLTGLLGSTRPTKLDHIHTCLTLATVRLLAHLYAEFDKKTTIDVAKKTNMYSHRISIIKRLTDEVRFLADRT